MKREDLEAREFGLIIASSNFPFYAAPEADAVMDAMEARIKELEHKLYGSSGQSTRLLNRINNFRSTDSKATDLIEDCYKCIHQQMATISKMETTQKWIRAKDSLPKEGEIIYGAGKFIEGLFVLQNEEWYTKEEYDDYVFEETHGYNIDAIDFWMEKPKKPTTEDSSDVEKEK